MMLVVGSPSRKKERAETKVPLLREAETVSDLCRVFWQRRDIRIVVGP